MFRIFDVILSFVGLVVFMPILIVLWVIGLFDTGSPIFRQERVGLNQQPFILIKFRTMVIQTHSVATHLTSPSAITSFGHFLRRTKLDELPQLWNVLKGDMSLVGPRPCLFNQHELIKEREARDVFLSKPGITGLAQISGLDMSAPVQLAETDQKMLSNLTVSSYFYYILLTLLGKGAGDRIRL